jgi:hypothetical protein
MKFTKNARHSLNCGNSSLRSSNSPQFLTLIPRFSLREFHEAAFFIAFGFSAGYPLGEDSVKSQA